MTMNQILLDETFEVAGFISPDTSGDHVNTRYLKKKALIFQFSTSFKVSLSYNYHILLICSAPVDFFY